VQTAVIVLDAVEQTVAVESFVLCSVEVLAEFVQEVLVQIEKAV